MSRESSLFAFLVAADGVLPPHHGPEEGSGGDLAVWWSGGDRGVRVGFFEDSVGVVCAGGPYGHSAGLVRDLADGRTNEPVPLDGPEAAAWLVRCVAWLLERHLKGELTPDVNPLARGQGKKKWRRRHGDYFTNLNANPLFAGKFRVL